MGKIREFLKNLFTKGNFLTGMFGLFTGLFLTILTKFMSKNTFQDVAIFIGVGVGWLLLIFLLGFLLNKTLFKDDE